MTAVRTFTEPDRPAFVNIPAADSEPERMCARCRAPWHIGGVIDGHEAKRITFAQLVKMAEGVFTPATLRTYSRADRGAAFFHPLLRREAGEVRYSACEANLVILRHQGIDVAPHEKAIATYDPDAPTSRRMKLLEEMLARDEAEVRALREADTDAAWMARWRALNTRAEQTVRWIDETNREYGFTHGDGLLVTNRFRDRRTMLRSCFPMLTDRAFDALWSQFRVFLEREGGAHHLRDAALYDPLTEFGGAE